MNPLALVGLGLLLWWIANNADAAAVDTPAVPAPDGGSPQETGAAPFDVGPSVEVPMDIAIPGYTIEENTVTPDEAQQVNAFLSVIRQFESAGRYNVLFGGKTFADFSRHPNTPVYFTNPLTGKRDYSTAAGAYQINYPTWLEINKLEALPDFTPGSQDRAAWLLLNRIGAIDALLTQGQGITAALAIASKRWASLPYSQSGQPKQTLQTALNAFSASGGVIV